MVVFEKEICYFINVNIIYIMCSLIIDNIIYFLNN